MTNDEVRTPSTDTDHGHGHETRTRFTNMKGTDTRVNVKGKRWGSLEIVSSSDERVFRDLAIWS